jgi:hypothetical protein
MHSAFHSMRVLVIGKGFSKVYGMQYVAKKLKVTPSSILLAIQEGFSIKGLYFDEALEG